VTRRHCELLRDGVDVEQAGSAHRGAVRFGHGLGPFIESNGSRPTNAIGGRLFLTVLTQRWPGDTAGACPNRPAVWPRAPTAPSRREPMIRPESPRRICSVMRDCIRGND
jgi:hypothetical protein